MDSGVVLTEVGISFREGTGEVKTLQDVTNDIQRQREAVDHEDWGSALLGFREQEKYYEKNERRPKLSRIVDADLDIIGDELVQIRYGDVERGGI